MQGSTSNGAPPAAVKSSALPASRDAVKRPTTVADARSARPGTTPSFLDTIEQLARVLRCVPSAEELQVVWDGLDASALPDEVRRRLSASNVNGADALALAPHEHEGVGGKRRVVIPLKTLKRGLDSQRAVSAPEGRGLPLWIAVRALKAAWHADGTWPLRGCDEGPVPEEPRATSMQSGPRADTGLEPPDAAASDGSVSDEASGSESESAAGGAAQASATPAAEPSLTVSLAQLPRSIWPSHLLVRSATAAQPAQQQEAAKEGEQRTIHVQVRTIEPGPPARPDPAPRDVARMYARLAALRMEESPS